MTDIASKAWEIIQSEYDRLINEGVDSTNARDLMGKDAFDLEAFSSWKPSDIQKAKNELLTYGFIEKNVLGEYRLPDE